jgi:hypothetical protein
LRLARSISERLGAYRPQAAEGPFLVGPEQARISGDIRRQDRRQPPLDPLLGHRPAFPGQRHHIAVEICHRAI